MGIPQQVHNFALSYTVLYVGKESNSYLFLIPQTLVSVAKEGLINYTKLTICSIMRDRGQRALFWCGISIQTGSCIGALIMFPLVNVFKFFHQAESC